MITKLSIFNFQLSTLKSGQILVIGILVLGVVLIISASMFERTAIFLRSNANSTLKEQATSLAEAGIDYAIQRLNDTASAYPNVSGEGTDLQTLSVGQVGITVANKSQNVKTITATGYIPNTTSPKAKRTVKVDVAIDSTLTEFRFAIQVGAGGINMENSSRINGTTYSNGSITGANSSLINGDAYAVGTISTPHPTVTGTRHEGSPLSILPTLNYQLWKDAANINNDPITCSPDCEITSPTTIGPKKYIGNLIIRESGTIVTMNGPVHVTGNFVIKNFATIKLASSFGSNGTVLIVDGSITVSNSGHFEPTTANPKGYILAVSTSTYDPAISIGNTGATAIFYALDGTAQLQNQAEASALVAKTLNMTNTATLNYDQGLAGANFSSGPSGGWVVKKGTYRQTSPP